MERAIVRQYALCGITEQCPIRPQNMACFACKKGRTNPKVQALCRLMDTYSQQFTFEFVCLDCLQRCFKSDVRDLRLAYKQAKLTSKFAKLFEWADSHAKECKDSKPFVNLLKAREEGREPHPYLLRQCWIEKNKVTMKSMQFIG